MKVVKHCIRSPDCDAKYILTSSLNKHHDVLNAWVKHSISQIDKSKI